MGNLRRAGPQSPPAHSPRPFFRLLANTTMEEFDMTMHELEALLEGRLTEDDLETLRAEAEFSRSFDEAVERFRQINPASVSLWWGFA